jgi:putative heme-binding domain-containing protein
VRLQVATAARRIDGVDAMPLLIDILARSENDRLIPHVVWQNLHPLLEQDGLRFLRLSKADNVKDSPAVAALLPRVVDRVAGSRDPAVIAALVAALVAESKTDPAALQKCLAALAAKLEHHEIATEQLAALRPQLEKLTDGILSGSSSDPLYTSAALLAATWQDARALKVARELFAAESQPPAARAQALAALVAAKDATLEASLERLFSAGAGSPIEVRSAALGLLEGIDAPWVARVVLANHSKLEPELRPQAVELLTRRQRWAEALLDAIGRKEIPASALNVNQVRQLLVRGDSAFVEKVKAQWGAMRTDRDPKREEVIAEMRTFLRRTPGDAKLGQEVFKRVCGQCHKLHGEGFDVGPDITLNGRNSFEQLLSNVFDPSLVIGAAYQARTVAVDDGRVLTGLVAEESPDRLVLKTQGGKLETIATAEIEEMATSRLSLMPEDIEKQLKPQELADLFALLTLDKPPGDPTARKLPGARAPWPRAEENPERFDGLVNEVAPGFSAIKAGKPGLAIVAEHGGRDGVLCTRPVAAEQPCVLRGTFELPGGKSSRLVLAVSHEPAGAWKLAVVADGRALHRSLVSGAEGPTWRTVSVDLSAFAGKKVKLDLIAATHDGQRDAAYWAQAEIVSD